MDSLSIGSVAMDVTSGIVCGIFCTNDPNRSEDETHSRVVQCRKIGTMSEIIRADNSLRSAIVDEP